ncbi:uncharacterized protein Eint_051115 [Encephalitozoon intestinalis ATCC 50506]|uniref:Uncharacterized protein n=1 Tax=Encephalitozoon intestinalis (strain ATCC 50506) TaxID=876142 RepID=W8P8Y8_ENCIT|nr:uncharacterized protein Eint_051115 [Encephalitozoon intestinalis ATCC 50506]AHL30103.1 hypothetical protein Eint_051115 [Encephalitozoon intestinalis ATCC 50506]UTX45273.1 hypothetical protein GPK93_05g08190 [Encephalitozoon intestinalis]
MIIADLDRISISSETRPRQQHIEEARKIVKANSKYRGDPGYKHFLDETVKGLCKGCSNEDIFHVIRSLQRMIRPKARILGEDLYYRK